MRERECGWKKISPGTAAAWELSGKMSHWKKSTPWAVVRIKVARGKKSEKIFFDFSISHFFKEIADISGCKMGVYKIYRRAEHIISTPTIRQDLIWRIL
jgi:hypothetical protein